MSFEDKKLDGSITTEVDNERGELKVFKKAFNPDTGEELDDPIQDTYIKSTLQTRQTELEAELSDVEAMLAEFD